MKIPVYSDSAYYEFVLCPHLCLNGFRIEIDGIAQSRVDKVRDLARYPLSYEFLNVCHEIRADGRNCSFRCAKCMYTMMDLDAAGVLDMYGKVFDVDRYYAHQEEVLAEYWRGLLQGNSYIEEIRPYFSARHWPWRSKLGAAVILGRKSIKKALRLGRVSSGTFSSRG